MLSSSHLFAMNASGEEEKEQGAYSRLLKVGIPLAKNKLKDIKDFEQKHVVTIKGDSELRRSEFNFMCIKADDEQVSFCVNSTFLTDYSPDILGYKNGAKWDLKNGIDNLHGKINYFLCDGDLNIKYDEKFLLMKL